MSCDECKKLIELEELGIITSKQLLELEAHVKNCPRCSYLRQRSKQLTYSLRNLPIMNAPDDLFSLIVYRIEKQAFIKNFIFFFAFMSFVLLIGSIFLNNIDYSIFSIDIEESVFYIFEVFWEIFYNNISLVYLLIGSFLAFIIFSVYKKRKELLS
ncbi:hypothetical protein Thena_1184 [Thermodesulfobium narugense DSM 14796]|uniref:Zinc-finger domain-containing protein n=1 Tax=Thermodesulfobium narugense DSM 14796 TaxID=747365 RepID=M1E7W1_9BACT|nr:zf-HC2 domain-containing protein [Thermodesulfobium narugense]AEE14803.1 hypothetical protein Thena_1184 [Thermodesulfobium narugense DSM 14796]